MNRTEIETFDYVFNPITGCYGPAGTPEHPNRCPYCYAHAFAHRFGKSEAERAFNPVFHPERLGQPAKVKKPSRVFVCSMADLFGKYVPWEWRWKVLDTIKHSPQHSFFLLTKEADRMGSEFLPANCWAGVSITGGESQYSIQCQIESLVSLTVPRYLSAEPLLGGFFIGSRIRELSWVIIGAWTGPGAKPPERAWVESLTAQCVEAGIPVWHKSSLGELATRKEKP